MKLAGPLLVIAVLGGAVAWGLARGASDGQDGFEPPPAFTAATQPRLPTADEFAAEEARQTPKELFGHACGTCHTLAAAGTESITGPDLDRVRYTQRRVRDQIRTGSLDSAMPANLLTGRSARRVAAYVARVGGRRAR
ncbi:MAG: cytochrome c [Solirubrobacterales bacterium]|nr:cytochrome c [Solirubrobacterales bacterium]